MSVASILGADGKIAAAFGGGGGTLAGTVTNPMTAPLLGGGFAIENIANVRTTTIESRPAPFPNFVEFLSDVEIDTGKQLRSGVIRTNTVEALTGAVIETVNPLLVTDALRVKGEFPLIQFEDLSGNNKGYIYVDTSANRMNVQLPSDTLYINSAVNPTIQLNSQGAPNLEVNIAYDSLLDNLQIDKSVAISSGVNETLGLTYTGTIPAAHGIVFKNTTDAFEGSFSYIQAGGPGQFVLDRSTQIRDPGTTPRIFLIADGASPVTNGQLVYDASSQRMNVTRDFEVRGTTGAPTTGLRIGPVVNPVTLTYTQATSTLAADKQVQFDAFCPRTAIAPTIGDSLTNKTYVDGGVRFKSTREYYVSKQGNNTTGNGSANAPYLTIQKAITEAQLLAGAPDTVDVINVAPGLYTENLLMTRGFMTIQGNNETFRPAGTTTIQGTITITLGGADDLFTKTVNITGLSLNGSILDNSTCQHSVGLATLNIQNTTGAAPAVLFQPSAGMTDARLYVDRCFISHQVNNTAVAMGVGQLYMSNTLIDVFTNNIALALLDNAIGAPGGVASQVVLCQFANSNNSATLAPLVLLNSNGTNIHAFGNCSFIYSNATVKSGSPNSSGILFEGTNNMTANVAQCVFALAGTTHPANSVIMKSAAATGTMVVFNTANEALNGLAHKVDSGIVKLNSTAVN
jgi:hypothetical protein